MLIVILSESGCPGFKDVQDVIVRFSLVPWLCWGMFAGFWMTTIIFCQNQDVQDLRINRM
jgi:hypothetical protein